MILIAAENRELALSISINQRNPKPEHKGPGTGYYLALTFGTLLSSQRADAQEIHPSGLHSRLDVQHYAGFQRPHQGGWSGGPSGPRGAWRTVHGPEGPLQGGPDRPRQAPSRAPPRAREGWVGGGPFSGHPRGPELHAHARADGLRRLGDAVLPGALARAAHDHQVAMPQREPEARSAADGPEHQRAR
jgi:hypothetical protein